MSLTLALNTALSGLNVNQRALATVSQNIANANTVGYSRKVVEQSSLVLAGGGGAGVKVDTISRKVDEYLIRAVRNGAADIASSNAVQDYMERLQVYLGEPGQGNTIDEQIQSFFSSLQSLAETPERTSFRSQVVANADTLARNLSDLGYATQNLRYQADQDIDAAINDLNTNLEKLSVINLAISQAAALGNSSAELLDKRDLTLKSISEIIDPQVMIQGDGQAYLYTRGGEPLVTEQLYGLDYSPASSIQSFIGGLRSDAMTLHLVNSRGEFGPSIAELVSSGVGDEVTTDDIRGGKLAALLQLRDTILPGTLAQLDQLAATLRDSVNAVHNAGSGFPGASEYVSTRGVLPTDYTGVAGKVQIGLLNSDGTPLQSLYASERTSGTAMRPLTLDFDALDGGYGNGKPTIQSIMDEINSYYGVPKNRVSLGNLNQIQLGSLSSQIPAAPPNFSFDFDIENISGAAGQFFVTDVEVWDDTATDITNVSTTQPQVVLDNAATYITTAGSSSVTLTTAAPHELGVGDWVYLGDPGVPSIDGISAAALTGYFQITSVTSGTFTVKTSGIATAGATTGVVGLTALSKYDEIASGDHRRTSAQGAFTANLSANDSSEYYDFVVHMGAVDADGNVSSGTVTYRVSRENNILNLRVSGASVTGLAQLETPSTNTATLRAFMVDENGEEIPEVNGKSPDVKGYLKIESVRDGAYVALADINSIEVGVSGVKEASNRNFFHYMELNNFFESNVPTDTGDTVAGSAVNLAVEQRLIDQPSLITTGVLTRSNQSADPEDAPIYSYERFSGDNQMVQRLAKLGFQSISFGEAGALPATQLSFGGYAGEMLGYLADVTRNAESDASNKQTLLNGLQSRSDAISGVNLDQEMADTIIYQNAYTASARVVTVTNELFDTLLGMFN